MAKFCANCGTTLDDAAKFCAACGQATAAPAAPPAMATPEPFQQPAPVYQPFDQPAQYPDPQYQQPTPLPYQQPYAPAAPVKKKKSKLPIILGVIALAFVGLIVAIVVIAMSVVGKAAKADYYTIGDDQIPSIKLVLGEVRKITSTSTSIANGATTKELVYKVDADQGAEMQEYSAYLRDEDGFALLSSADSKKSNGRYSLERDSVQEGYMLTLDIAYDREGYTITIKKLKGEAEPNPNLNPTGNLTPGDDDYSQAMKENYYKIGGEQIASVRKVLSEDRTIVNISDTTDGNDIYKAISYSVTDADPSDDMYDYVQYLRQQEGFYLLSDLDFSTSYASCELGKDSAAAGYMLVVNVVYNSSGYTVTVGKEEGTLTLLGSDEVGLWRGEFADWVELVYFYDDGSCRMGIFYYDPDKENLLLTGDYSIADGTLTLSDVEDDDGGAYNDMYFAIVLDGDILTLDGESEYVRVAAADEDDVIDDPYAAYGPG